MRILVWFFEVRQWTLTEDWSFQLDEDNEIVIPKDFSFDGASIPRPFWAILSPTGLLLIPGLLHDYGYMYNRLLKKGKDGKLEPHMAKAGKAYWDTLFRKVSNQVNGLWLVSAIAWFGVWSGGYCAWKKHRKNDLTPTEIDD